MTPPLQRLLCLVLTSLSLNEPAAADPLEESKRYADSRMGQVLSANLRTPSGAAIAPSSPLATGESSVALGPGSIATRDYTLSLGHASIKRQLTHLAPGTEGDDAVSLRQLQGYAETMQAGAQTVLNARIDAMEKTLMEGIAMSAALAGLRINPASPGPNHLALGLGAYAGRQALALGYFRQLGRSAMLNASVATLGTKGPLTSSFGASIGW